MGCLNPYRLGLLLLVGLLSLLNPDRASAHALAPSLLSLQGAGEGLYAVTWKTPLQRVPGSELRPVLPASCSAQDEPTAAPEGTGLVVRWTVDCGESGLTGQRIAVEGIAGSRADVLLRVAGNGSSFQQVLTASAPDFTVPEQQGWLGVFQQYVVLGIEHLLTGLDHVLFVVALVLLVRARRPLIITITSFTIGHSVTLSAAVLGYVYFPQSIAEVVIAFSILITFAGVIRDDPRSLLKRWPWAIAFCFGLLHGLGFAGALTEVGLPQSDIPLALLAFNIGIEIGQLLLIGLLLLSGYVLRQVTPRLPAWQALPIYAVGTLSGFWFWQRLLGL